MKSLGSRLTYYYALVVMCTVISTMIIGYWLLRDELIHGIDLLNNAEFREIRDRVEAQHAPIVEGDFLRRVAEHAEIDAQLYFFQVRRNGKVLFRSPNMRTVVLEPNPRGETNWTTATSRLGAVRVGQFPEGEFNVQIATSLRSIEHFSSYYLKAGLLVSGVAAALSIFFGHRLSRLALDPIQRIQRTAEGINADNLSARIPTDSANDEITALARLLNRMFDRLEVSFNRLWRFAGDASHELKTPLSVMRLQSEKLLLQGNLPPSQQEIIQQQLESINRLSSVIEKLLFLAKSEVRGIRPNLKSQNTADFIQHFCEDAQILCEDQSISLEVTRNESLLGIFDATLLRQVLSNLLSNALRVTPTGGSITIASWRDDGCWKVKMEDTGPGLPAPDLQRIFEPFIRVRQTGDHVSHDDVGTGLGLAICRSVIEIHEGSIRAENRQPGPGLRVSFELPVVAKQKHDTDELVPTPSLRWEKAESSTHGESEEIV
jgi:signal transduction histidine kinase